MNNPDNQSDCNCPNGLRYDQCGHPKHHLSPVLCAEPGPLGGRCDMEKGHEGLHHGYLSEAGVEAMEAEADWPPCMNSGPLGGICLRERGHEGDHKLGWRRRPGECCCTDLVPLHPDCPVHALYRCTCTADVRSKQTCPVHQDRDPVEIRPDYYGGKHHPYEVFKVIRAWWPVATGPGVFFLGNALKYIRRAGQKEGSDSIEDLRKAITYLQNELEAIERERNA